VATVGGFAYWFIGGYGGEPIPYRQLSHFENCGVAGADWPAGLAGDCSVFTSDRRPQTVALSILVLVEMLNALNALSQNESLLTFPPWRNLWLLAAIALSIGQHLMILYVPFFQPVFGVAPLNRAEWWLVTVASVPVILLDELLKLITRIKEARSTATVFVAKPQLAPKANHGDKAV
jgi:Ca2+ transporting ATPase